MNITDITASIVNHMETTPDAVNFDTDIERILWSGFSEFLNTAWKMRKFQKQFFQHKDKRSLEEAKKFEKLFDELLVGLKNQKVEPQLKL